MKESIIRLRALEKQRFAYRYALNVVDFDAETVAPEGSADGRAEACEVLSRADFDLLVNDNTAALLRQATQDAETEQERAEVRELQRAYDQISKIPADEYAAFTKLTQQSIPAWVKAKRTNDFSVFAPYLEKIVAARRAQARYFAPDRDPYEVLLDQYEHGLTIAQCDEFFATLRETIVPLLADIRDHGTPIRTDFLDQDWPIDAQRKVSEKIMQLWGLDPAHCYLAESEHPFTTEFWRGDVRITTHYMSRDMFSNLYSVAHEGGHALYELNIDPAYDYTAVTGGATMGIHESQSRLFENYVGRSRAFVHCLYPTLRELFPTQLADVTEEEIWRAVNRAGPDPYRGRRADLRAAHHGALRDRESADPGHAGRGRPARRLERQVQGVPGRGRARQRPRLPAGHSLVDGRHWLLPQLCAGQRLRCPGHRRPAQEHGSGRSVGCRRHGASEGRAERACMAVGQHEGTPVAGAKPVRRQV